MNFESFIAGFVVGFLLCGWLLSVSKSTKQSDENTTESQLAEYQRLLLIAQTQQQITEVTAGTRNTQAAHRLSTQLSRISPEL